MKTHYRFLKPVRVSLVLACLAMLTPVWAASPTAPGDQPLIGAVSKTSALEQLNAFVAETQTATGKFVQSGDSMGPNGVSSGDFAFARPGKFRWAVTDPYPQLLVADGQDVYFHDIDLNQVTVRPMGGALGSTPAAILFGTGNMQERFEISDQGEVNGLQWLEAIPREKEAGFERIRIGFANNLPAAMDVLDAFNNTSRFVFSEVQANPAIDVGFFKFEIPAGTDIVRP